MMGAGWLCCGAPRPAGDPPLWFQKSMEALPFFIVAAVGLAMLVSLLLRYNPRFREFWAKHVCAFMEEHGGKTE